MAAILFHFAGNAFGELFAISVGTEVASAVLSVTAALLVIVVWTERGTALGSLATRGMGGE